MKIWQEKMRALAGFITFGLVPLGLLLETCSVIWMSRRRYDPGQQIMFYGNDECQPGQLTGGWD